MQRSLPLAARDLCLSGLGLLQSGFRGDRDEGVENWIQPFNPGQAGLGEFDRGYLFFLHCLADFSQVEQR